MGLNGSGSRQPGAGIDWRAVARGAAFGLLVIVPLSIYQGTLHDPCDAPFWVFAGLLFAFAIAGFVAAVGNRSNAFTHGAFGALGALAIWIVIRLIRNTVVGHSSAQCGSGLLSIITTGVLAIAFGSLGGFVSARRSDEHR